MNKSIEFEETETVIVADVGGTNVRLGLYVDGAKTVTFDMKEKCSKFKSFEEALQTYMEKHHIAPKYLVVGAAGCLNEVTGEITATNTPWKVSKPKIKKKFDHFKHVRVVNDFALQGWALNLLPENQYAPIFREKLFADLKTEQVVIIGPGTGLGTCLILRDREKDRVIYTSEAGHSTIPHVDFKNSEDNNDRDRVLIALKDYFAKKNTTPIIEHIVSGTGIRYVYHALRDGVIPEDKNKLIDAYNVEQQAREGDEIALKTFKIFNAYLGAHAGTLAATTKTGIIFFCGGLMASPWVREQLQQYDDFKKQFEARAAMTNAMKQVQFAASLNREIAELGLAARAQSIIDLGKRELSTGRNKIISSMQILNSLIGIYTPHIAKEWKIVSENLSRALNFGVQENEGEDNGFTLNANSNPQTIVHQNRFPFQESGRSCIGG